MTSLCVQHKHEIKFILLESGGKNLPNAISQKYMQCKVIQNIWSKCYLCQNWVFNKMRFRQSLRTNKNVFSPSLFLQLSIFNPIFAELL